MKKIVIFVILMMIIVFAFKDNTQNKVELPVYSIQNNTFKQLMDSILNSSINCNKFPENREWYVSGRSFFDTLKKVKYYEISISILKKDFLFSYTNHDEILGLLEYNNLTIYLLDNYPDQLFKRTTMIKSVSYNDLKKKGKFYVEPFSDYPVWRYYYNQNIFIENSFNKYDCKQWELK